MNETIQTEGTSPQKHDGRTDTQATHPRELREFHLTILGVLADEPMYGLAVKRALEDYYGKEINHGRLYPNLDELVELGLVAKGELDKRTNEYALTADGREALATRAGFLDDSPDEADESEHRLADAEPKTVRTDGGDE